MCPHSSQSEGHHDGLRYPPRLSSLLLSRIQDPCHGWCKGSDSCGQEPERRPGRPPEWPLHWLRPDHAPADDHWQQHGPHAAGWSSAWRYWLRSVGKVTSNKQLYTYPPCVADQRAAVGAVHHLQDGRHQPRADGHRAQDDRWWPLDIYLYLESYRRWLMFQPRCRWPP